VIAETACSRAIFGSSRRSAPGKDLNGDLKQMGLSDVAQYWSNVFKSMPGMAGLLAALAVLGVLVVVIGIEAARRRELSLHLHALSEAMDEQSRLMERMRRLFARSNLEVEEVNILRGMLTQWDKSISLSQPIVDKKTRK